MDAQKAARTRLVLSVLSRPYHFCRLTTEAINVYTEGWEGLKAEVQGKLLREDFQEVDQSTAAEQQGWSHKSMSERDMIPNPHQQRPLRAWASRWVHSVTVGSHGLQRSHRPHADGVLTRTSAAGRGVNWPQCCRPSVFLFFGRQAKPVLERSNMTPRYYYAERLLLRLCLGFVKLHAVPQNSTKPQRTTETWIRNGTHLARHQGHRHDAECIYDEHDPYQPVLASTS